MRGVLRRKSFSDDRLVLKTLGFEERGSLLSVYQSVVRLYSSGCIDAGDGFSARGE